MITMTYAAVLGLMFFGLSIRTIRIRRGSGVAVGDGGHTTLAKASRAHANFAEYVPLCLLLVYLLEQTSPGALWIHAMGGTLVVGRLIHAYGISQTEENFNFRVLGMVLTFVVLMSTSVGLLIDSAM